MILKFSNMVKIGNKGWMAGDNINGLFCYDFMTKQIEQKARFKDELFYFSNHRRKMRTFAEIIKVKDSLVFIPLWANEIAVYDMNNDKMRYCGFKDKPESANAYLGYNYGNYVYFAMMRSKMIFKFDVEHNCIHAIDLLAQIDINDFDKDSIPFWKCGCMDDNKIYLVVAESNIVVEYTIPNGAINIYRIGYESILGIAAVQDDIWVFTINGNVIRWDKNRGESLKFSIQSNDLFTDNYIKIYIHEGYTYLIGAYNDNDVLAIRHSDNNIARKKTCLFVEGDLKYTDLWSKNFSWMDCRQQIFAQYHSGAFCLTDSLDDSFIEPIKISVNDYMDGECLYITESCLLALNDFLEISNCNSKVGISANTGKSIFNTLKIDYH